MPRIFHLLFTPASQLYGEHTKGLRNSGLTLQLSQEQKQNMAAVIGDECLHFIQPKTRAFHRREKIKYFLWRVLIGC